MTIRTRPAITTWCIADSAPAVAMAGLAPAHAGVDTVGPAEHAGTALRIGDEHVSVPGADGAAAPAKTVTVPRPVPPGKPELRAIGRARTEGA